MCKSILIKSKLQDFEDLFPRFQGYLTCVNIMKYKQISLDLIREAIKISGMTERQFMREYYGGTGTHADLKSFFSTKMGAEKICKMCNILQVPIQSLFEIENEEQDNIPQSQGNINDVKSIVVEQATLELKSEIKALNMLLEEKNERIKHLQQMNEMLLGIVKVGGNQ